MRRRERKAVRADGAARGRRFSMAHRLYLRIYGALMISLGLAACLFGLAHWLYDPEHLNSGNEAIAELASSVLPPASASSAQQQAALTRWARRLHTDLALYTRAGVPVAAAGEPLPPLTKARRGAKLFGPMAVFTLQLPDGRWLVGQRAYGKRAPLGLLAMLVLIALVVAVAAYPAVRRLTRRLERLQESVETWGGGQLGTRVAVEGKDEVARLATSFNQAAARIEALVGAQKNLLANASHELRSPLARIRMAVELMQEQAAPAIRDELTRNIGELDQLIDEVLLASRLDATAELARSDEQADLAAIVAEECTRVGATFDAAALTLPGDARLLRRLVRNLLENAARYGAGSGVHASLRLHGKEAIVLDVCDSGPGVPEAERERIFEPFYRVPGASESAGGVGLGLSLVRQIARHHGGEVRCLAGEPGGCCFRVQLPASLPGL
ncbi:HAMP domain-containing sensor histidine kinase [Massilia sp. CCM 9210]|uniref:HAMP domain-containing sensor histidine kinase n=1 Tax=Massilia scottii TaxID=3057166 RepID=UPI0027966F35|nr:HAMP domain-containing sensor histidine kinase [Massilia sp. CCM 9210]MDQ1817164.1 HAMP domain-containing sensor histidine kinase [Massilia sp. CCM 9210]